MSEIYHILSRGVDKRKIFMDERDYYRFVHDLFEFNDEAPAFNNSYHFRNPDKIIDFANRYRTEELQPREPVVDIFAFCLMPNHYHLLLSPKREEAVSFFMRKINVGYANYFNKKYERKGTLFEGRYKSVLIDSQSHFIHLPYYIHLNPLDLVNPEWRKRKINNLQKALSFLDSYRWSSHLDYSGGQNFPSVLRQDLLLQIFGGEKGYRNKIKSWLMDSDVNRIGSYTLE